MSETDLTSILGPKMPDWQPPPSPFDVRFEKTGLIGNHVTLVPLDADLHAAGLFASFAEDKQGIIWHYLLSGPFETLAEYTDYLRAMTSSKDVFFFAIQDNATGHFVGVASYLRINPTAGTIEVGHICFAPALQATIGATEQLSPPRLCVCGCHSHTHTHFRFLQLVRSLSCHCKLSLLSLTK